MKSQLGLSLVILAVLSVPPAWSQTGGDQSPSGGDQSQSGGDQSQSGSTSQSPSGSLNQPLGGTTDQSGSGDQSPSSTGPQVAYTHPEQLPPLTLLNEVTASTGIQLSMSTGWLTNYNSYGSLSGTYWQTLGTVAGGVHITQFRPTLMWDLRYSGGISLSTLTLANVASYANLNQSAGGKVLWQLGKRWQLALNDSYVYTDDPFEPFLTIEGVPTFNNPNPVFYVPRAITESNLGSASLTYQFGPHDSLNFTGGESFQRYLDTNLSADNSFAYSVGSNYQHDFSPRFSAGGGYRLHCFRLRTWPVALRNSGHNRVRQLSLESDHIRNRFSRSREHGQQGHRSTVLFPGFWLLRLSRSAPDPVEPGRGSDLRLDETAERIPVGIQASEFRWWWSAGYGKALSAYYRLPAVAEPALEFLCGRFLQQQPVDIAIPPQRVS